MGHTLSLPVNLLEGSSRGNEYDGLEMQNQAALQECEEDRPQEEGSEGQVDLIGARHRMLNITKETRVV